MKIHGGIWSIENVGGCAVEYEGGEEISRTPGRWVETDDRGDGDWEGSMVEGISFTDDDEQEYRVIR